MIKLYRDDSGDILPYVIRDSKGKLSRWERTPEECARSLRNGGNPESSTPEECNAELIGTYESLEVMQLELMLED